MSVIDLVAKAVSRPAGRIVEAPVREIVEEALRHASLASPQDVQGLRSDLAKFTAQLHELRNQLSSLTDSVKAVQSEVENAEMLAHEANRKAEAALAMAREGEVHDLARDAANQANAAQEAVIAALAKLSALETRQAPPADPPVASPAATPPADEDDDDSRPGRKSLEHLGCKVEGCTEQHRSKGFCSRHYQAWRRSKLDGYVAPLGLISHEGRVVRVPVSYEGDAYTISGKGRAMKIRIGKNNVDYDVVNRA